MRMLSGVLRQESPAMRERPALSSADSILMAYQILDSFARHDQEMPVDGMSLPLVEEVCHTFSFSAFHALSSSILPSIAVHAPRPRSALDATTAQASLFVRGVILATG